MNIRPSSDQIKKPHRPRLADVVGPGLITGASDDDPMAYASVLRWLTISLFAYVATVFAVRVPWLTVAQNLVAAHIELSGDYFAIVVAVFGTTISPRLFFWQAAEAVEDEKEDPHSKPLIKAPMGATRFRLRTLEKVRAERSLHVLAYNLKRMTAPRGSRGAAGSAMRSQRPAQAGEGSGQRFISIEIWRERSCGRARAPARHPVRRR